LWAQPELNHQVGPGGTNQRHDALRVDASRVDEVINDTRGVSLHFIRASALTRGLRGRRCRCGGCLQAHAIAACEPPSLLLFSGASGEGKTRIDVSRRLSDAVLTRRTSARITTSRWSLDEASAAFAGH